VTKTIRTVAVATALALASLGVAGGASAAPNPHSQSNPGATHRDSTPGPNASHASKAKAYGKFCQAESKKHVAGQKGTPFSLCVTAMAKLANGLTKSPAKACKAESKKHVAGQKGTPFSRCVSAAAKLKHEQEQSSTT
jgi:hypothetical protein